MPFWMMVKIAASLDTPTDGEADPAVVNLSAFETFPLCDVTQHHGIDPFAVDFELGYRRFRGEFLAVLANARDLGALSHLPGVFLRLAEALDLGAMDVAHALAAPPPVTSPDRSHAHG